MKIAINRCYGGFRLSHAATVRYAEIKGLPLTWEVDESSKINGRTDPEEAFVVHYHVGDEYFNPYDIDRTDPALIQTIEEMGDKANSDVSDIRIIEIPDGVSWVLDEYDGIESVHETHRSWS